VLRFTNHCGTTADVRSIQRAGFNNTCQEQNQQGKRGQRPSTQFVEQGKLAESEEKSLQRQADYAQIYWRPTKWTPEPGVEAGLLDARLLCPSWQEQRDQEVAIREDCRRQGRCVVDSRSWSERRKKTESPRSLVAAPYYIQVRDVRLKFGAADFATAREVAAVHHRLVHILKLTHTEAAI
jgi:hypothetical protein